MLAGAFAAIFWGLPVEPSQAQLWLFIRFVSPVVIVAGIIWAIVAERTPSDAERLVNVPPAADITCPFCQGSLSPTEWRCVTCGIRRK